MEVWIASHLTSSTNWLLDAIKSASKYKVIVSISGDPKCIDAIIAQCPPNATIKVRTERQFQMDHYKLLLDETKLQDEDLVIFLDDDDLLLKVPDNITVGCIGYQYIGVDPDNTSRYKFNDIANSENISDIIHNNKMLIEQDFSGTMLSIKYSRKYFKTRKSIAQQLEDVELMNFIEDLPGVTILKTPNTFHRIKEGPSLWSTEVINIVQEEQKRIEESKGKLIEIEKKLQLIQEQQREIAELHQKFRDLGIELDPRRM
jgi:hypothetical protein